MAKTLVSAMKNEGLFVLEWVAYHRLIGFDNIVVVSNDCDDGTDELLDVLAQAGEITHLRQTLAPGQSAQAGAAELLNQSGLLRHGDWVLWIDADEFLNIHCGDRNVDSLIEFIRPRRGMLIQWRIFGDSGRQRFSGRHISEEFTGASRLMFKPNLEIKTFFEHGPWIEGLATHGINRPALTADSGFSGADFLSSSGAPLSGEFPPTRKWLSGQNPPTTRRVSWSERGWEVAQINHYIVRTPDHFKLKRLRGRGWLAESQGKQNKRHTAKFYAEMNRNDVLDRSILFHEKAVTQRISEMLSNDAIAAAQARVHHRVTEKLRESAW